MLWNPRGHGRELTSFSSVVDACLLLGIVTEDDLEYGHEHPAQQLPWGPRPCSADCNRPQGSCNPSSIPSRVDQLEGTARTLEAPRSNSARVGVVFMHMFNDYARRKARMSIRDFLNVILLMCAFDTDTKQKTGSLKCVY